MTIALITGGNRGLGRSAAIALAKRGVDVMFTYRSNADEARQVVAEIEAAGARAAALQLGINASTDFVAFADAVRAQLDAWKAPSFDWLVNNAGFGLYAPFAQTTAQQLDDIYATHFRGPYLLTQALLPLISDGGRILNVSSGLARFAMPGSSAYGAMKGAIEVLTRYQAKELGARGITANVVAPGAVATDFGGGRVRDNAEISKTIASNTALGRVGQAEDIGPAIAALLSDQLGWMTAQRIELSGGTFL